MSKVAATFYVLHGDDELRLQAEIGRLRAQLGDEAGLNISEFEGESASVAEIVNAVSSVPFLADRRLVIVRGLLAHIARKGAGESGRQAADRLYEALPQLPEWARLVLVERETLPENNRFVRLAHEHPAGFARAFIVPADTTDWIVKRAANEYGAEIERAAARALAQIAGKDLVRADNELAKLACYVNGERPISEADVDLLTPYLAEARIFDMVDAMAEGRGEKALRELHRLLGPQEEDPFGVMGMIVRQFRLLLLAKEHGSRAGLEAVLGANAKFVADKAERQARFFSLEQLEEIYRALQDYDYQVKTGEIKVELALDLIVSGIAR
ncbi:MAG: DNA polymerase III subunit delta [Aggregatilineales bacterium]